MRAFILAAGLGTRLKTLTNATPKALIKIEGKTMLERTIQKIVDLGIEQIGINTYHFADQITKYVDKIKNYYKGIEFKIFQESELLETGGAMENAREFLSYSDPFLVHNVDVVHNIDIAGMIEEYFENLDNDALALLACANKPSTRPWLVDEENYICGHKNTKLDQEILNREPKGSLKKMYFCGVHLISSDIFDFLEKGKYSITPKYLELIKKGLLIKSFNVGDAYHFDLGTGDKIKEAEKFLKKK